MEKVTQRYIITGCFILFIVLVCQATVCEDLEANCARLDIERNICSDPLESSVYCTKYCGHCSGPIVVPLCDDNDRSCQTMATPEYCSQEQGRQMCPKSCHSCKSSPVTDARGDTSVIPKNEAVNAGSKVNQTTFAAVQSTDEILDPACQDIDLGCFFHLHECYSSPMIKMMCQRSCHLCPSVPSPSVKENNFGAKTVPEALAANSDTVSIKVLSLTKFEPASDNCMDHDSQCTELILSYQCQTDLFLPRLCPDSCGLCNNTQNDTVSGNHTTSNTTCADHDPECPSLLTYCKAKEVLVSRLCQKTCQVCDQEIATTTVAPSVSSGYLATTEDCFDLDPKCDTITLGNACELNDLVSRVCPVTCKICNETRSKTSNVSECVDYDPDCHTLHYACGAVDLVDKLCPQTCAVCQYSQTCHICTDPFCDVHERSMQCPADEPYCLNSVINEIDGRRHVSKTCSTAMDCVQLWVNETSNDPRCQTFHADGVYHEAFSCHYCCQGDNCNAQLVPLETTLFRQ